MTLGVNQLLLTIWHHVALETTIRKQPNPVRRIMSFHYCSLVISLQSWKKIVELKPRVMGLSNWQIHAVSPALKHTRHLSFLHSWHLVAKIFPHRPTGFRAPSVRLRKRSEGITFPDRAEHCLDPSLGIVGVNIGPWASF